MKFTHQLVVGSLAALMLSACSGDPAQRRQAKDDFEYLNTSELSTWTPLAASQPQFYQNYQIPQGHFAGEVGKNVDIRPPQQILELIPSARYTLRDGETTFWLGHQADADKVWNTVLTTLKDRQIELRSQSPDRIETDWVTWQIDGEEQEPASRYEITRANLNGRYVVNIAFIDWQHEKQEAPLTAINKDRYSAMMANLVTTRYDQIQRDMAERLAQERSNDIAIGMGADRSGFPVIIARSPYDMLWPRLATLLPKMGFTVEDRRQSQGMIKTRYATPNDEFWESIGVEPITLPVGDYTLQLGDLENRTSINVTDATGKPIDEENLKGVALMLSSVIQQSNQE